MHKPIALAVAQTTVFAIGHTIGLTKGKAVYALHILGSVGKSTNTVICVLLIAHLVHADGTKYLFKGCLVDWFLENNYVVIYVGGYFQ